MIFLKGIHCFLVLDPFGSVLNFSLHGDGVTREQEENQGNFSVCS